MGDSSLTYSLKGRLTLSRSGWVILEVPNSIGNGLFQALDEPGIEQPISGSLGRYNAHVSVIRPEEVEQIGGADKILARGKLMSFNLGQVREIPSPGGWAEVSKCWVINVTSPDLMTLRRSLGLGDPKYPFHITFAIRKKNALSNKVASLIHRTKVAAITTTIKDSPIHGKGLFATRNFKIGDTVVPRFMSKLTGTDGRTKYDQSEQCRYTNHSNSPNCVLVVDGDYVNLVADRDIASGEELTGDYDTCHPVLGKEFDFTYRGKPYDGSADEAEPRPKSDPRDHSATRAILSILSTKGEEAEDRDAVHDGWDSAGDSERERTGQGLLGDHHPGADNSSDHSGFSKTAGAVHRRREQSTEVERGDVETLPCGGPQGKTHGLCDVPFEPMVSLIHSGFAKSAGSKAKPELPDGLRANSSDGGLSVNRNRVDYGERLKALRKRRGECPGCGQPFKEDEPYPNVDMCEVCETYGPTGKGFGMRVALVPTEKKADLAADIAAARDATAEPKSDAQADAGNYAKGKFRMHGLHFSLENPKGSTRSGVDKNGKAWSSTMTADYGYIRGTLGKDGDHVDVFIGDDPETEMVFVVDQIEPDTGKLDEHKVMFGYPTVAAATEGYLSNYSKGWKGLGAITALTMQQFKDWLNNGDQKKPVAGMKTKAASSIYMNAISQTPLNINPEQGVLGNLMNHLGAVKARGDRTIAEAGMQDQLQNAIDPNRSTRQMLSFINGTRQPLVSHPLDRLLAGDIA